MQKKFLILSSILIVLGLVGLTGIQLLWLRNSINAKEQSFDLAVFEALDEISLNLKYEGYKPLLNDFLRSQLGNSVDSSTTDTSNHIMIPSNDSTMQVFKKDGTFDTTLIIESEEKNPNKGMEYAEQVLSDLKSKAAVPDEEMGLPVDEDVKALVDQMKKEQSEFLQQIYRELISVQPITELIDTGQLEENISTALKNRGICTPFQYGISELTENNFVLASPKASLRDLFVSNFKINLLQRTFLDTKKNLVLFFPHKKEFLLNSMIWQISSSAFFLILVIVAFFLAIQIIFKQKYLSDMKTDFINNMTHELKTPIATISLASEMLKDKSIGGNDTNRERYAKIIIEENKRLSNHVESVLQIARLEKGEIQLNKTTVDIHKLIINLLNNFELQVNETGGEIMKKFKATDSMVEIDEMHFTNVISNLFDNALKYNDKTPFIEINTENEIGRFKISIKDNGVGLSKDDQKKVFEKFYRVQKGNLHDTKGFGLGLSYVKTIVEKHGGSIFVESKLKEGTTFIINIPKK